MSRMAPRNGRFWSHSEHIRGMLLYVIIDTNVVAYSDDKFHAFEPN